MSKETSPKHRGRSPFFWGVLIFIAYAGIAVLGITDAIDETTLLILMIAPAGLMIPLFRSASRRVDAGGQACFVKGEAQKRYIKRVAVSTSIYLIAMALMVMVENSGSEILVVRALVALLPGLAIIGVFWAIGRLILEEQDEFIRMLVVRQSLIATGITLSVASVWGFLESADLVVHADAYWWPVLWFVGLAVGATSNRIKFGAWGAV